ncbi:MAG: segregation and condensation protein [Acidobacteriota bacterium]|nr:segregation and condensation protein [Acidobacteriota bacterium]
MDGQGGPIAATSIAEGVETSSSIASNNETTGLSNESDASSLSSASTSASSSPDSSRAASESATADVDGSSAPFDLEDDVDDEADGVEEVDAEIVIHDADAEDLAEQMLALQRERRARASAEVAEGDDGIAPGGEPRSMAELMGIIEALVFVAEEPISAKMLAEVLREERGWVEVAVQELAKEFNERNAGLMLREVAGGWQFATRAEHHEHVRAFLKSRPSAKLSLAALETLAVIAYKQPITVPEILEIRGVQSSSAIKTLLDKRLIVAKGRKEVIGRPMMYGTSKEFLLQFGMKDLTELPNIEDFEDLTSGA